MKSDLFSFFDKKYVAVKGSVFKGLVDRTDKQNKFDTIIFNPPYLPDEEKDKDTALDGGKEGYELIEKFIEKSKEYLAENGIILLIFSSFTKKEKVDEIIKKNNFQYEELEKIRVFFEDIYCYKIEKDENRE